MSEFLEELRAALDGRPREERKVLLVGVLNRHLPKGRRAVLVGGALVEFYTTGAYVTGDVDVVGDREDIVPLLEGAGFERTGRVFSHSDLDLVADVAGRFLRKTETVVEMEVRGYVVPMVTVEDAVVDRLLAAKYWDSRTDWEQALLLFTAHRERLDRGSLKRKAGANEVEDWLGFLAEDAGVGTRPRYRGESKTER